MNTARFAVGADIRARRRHLYLSQTELSVLAECSLASVLNIERGAVPKRSAVLDRILAALDELEAGR